MAAQSHFQTRSQGSLRIIMLQFEWKEVTWGLVKMWIPEQPQVPMKQVCGKEVLVDSGTAGLNLSRRNSRKRPAGCPHGLSPRAAVRDPCCAPLEFREQDGPCSCDPTLGEGRAWKVSPGRAGAACPCSLTGRSLHRRHCPGPVGLTVARLCLFSRFMPPDDPLGRRGPTLSNFLSRKQKPPEPSWQHCPYGGWRPAPRGPSAGPCVWLAASQQGSCEDAQTPGTLWKRLWGPAAWGHMQGKARSGGQDSFVLPFLSAFTWRVVSPPAPRSPRPHAHMDFGQCYPLRDKDFIQSSRMPALHPAFTNLLCKIFNVLRPFFFFFGPCRSSKNLR